MGKRCFRTALSKVRPVRSGGEIVGTKRSVSIFAGSSEKGVDQIRKKNKDMHRNEFRRMVSGFITYHEIFHQQASSYLLGIFRRDTESNANDHAKKRVQKTYGVTIRSRNGSK